MENTFALVSDAPGECLDQNHKDWIPIKTVNWEVTRTLDMDDLGTTQRGFANSSFGKISLTSELALHSPKLMLSVANGTVRKELKIELCRSGDSSSTSMECYLEIIAKDAVIDKYEVSGGEEQIPEESWDIAYREIEVIYKKADPRSGKLGKGSDFAWKVAEGVMG